MELLVVVVAACGNESGSCKMGGSNDATEGICAAAVGKR